MIPDDTPACPGGKGMVYRRLGAGGPLVSAVGLGTMSWPGCRYGEAASGPLPVREAVEMLAAANECGITLLDTAEGYGLGAAESTLGAAFRELGRRNFIVVTKTGPLFGGPRPCDLSHRSLIARTEAALVRLGIERIDVLLAHWPDPQTPIEETMRAAADLIAAGKIGGFGVSNFPPPLLERALASGPVICNQLPFSLADRQIEDGRLDACIRNRVGVMAYSPLGKGILGGRYDKDRLPPPEDYRHQRPHFREHLERNLRLADAVRRLASEFGTAPAAVALAWALARPGISCAVPGAKSAAQVRELAEAARVLRDENFTRRLASLG